MALPVAYKSLTREMTAFAAIPTESAPELSKFYAFDQYVLSLNDDGSPATWDYRYTVTPDDDGATVAADMAPLISLTMVEGIAGLG